MAVDPNDPPSDPRDEEIEDGIVDTHALDDLDYLGLWEEQQADIARDEGRDDD